MLSLPDLPLEVLEAICRPLQLRDRLAVTSCCRTLLARADVAGSIQLWGSLGRGIQFRSFEEPRAAGCLARHAAGLRKVEVELSWTEEPDSGDLAALLGMLGGSGLVDLEIFGPEGFGMDPGAALQPLSRLTALTRLKLARGLEAVPAHLSALQGLVHLDLSLNEGLGGSGSPPAFEGLAHLLALTSLDLSVCNLKALPPQMPLLTRLQVLLLRDNHQLGEGGEMAFECLQCLPALRTLDLTTCGLQVVPRQLAALPALEYLDLNMNEALGQRDPADIFAVLSELTSLTSLSISNCQLRRAPAQLASLAALANLALGGNSLGAPSNVGEGGDALLPLEHLTALTCLDLRWNALLAVPPQVAALTGLHELLLSENNDLAKAGEAAFQPLLRLSVLTCLELRNTGLKSLPPQLSALAGCLMHLDLCNNKILGLNSNGQAFELLSNVTALTTLHLQFCSLERLPSELSALVALRQLELGGNEGLGCGADYDQVFGPLRPLCSLTRLGLDDAGLLHLPPQLSELRALCQLNLCGNRNLAQGQQGDAEMWCQLSGLPALERLNVYSCSLPSPAPLALLDLARRGVDVEGLPKRVE